MRCKKGKKYLLDYSYNELSDHDKKEFSRHLKECEECSNILKEIGFVRKRLSFWVLPKKAKTAFGLEGLSNRIITGKRSLWYSLPTFAKIALTAGIFIVLISILNVNVEVGESGFKIGFGLFQSSDKELDEQKIKDLLATENKKIMDSMLEILNERESKRAETVNQLIANILTQMELSRKYELQAILTEFEKFRLKTNQRFLTTGSTLENVVDYLTQASAKDTQKAKGKRI